VTQNQSSPSQESIVNDAGLRNDASLSPPPPASQSELVINPDSPHWAQPPVFGLLKALLTWVGSVVFLLMIPLILVIPYFIYLAATSGSPQPDALLADKTFLFLSILGVIPAHLLTFVVAYMVITKGGRHPFLQTLGLEWPRSLGSWAGIGLSAIIATVLLGLGALITWLFGGEKTDLDLIIESSLQARLATVFLAVVTAPIIEEVIYRGMLYPAIARVVGAGFAIALVSILFAGVHFYQYRNNLAVVAVITILSASLTTVRALSHRLLPSFVIHLVFNGVQSILILLQGMVGRDPITPPPVPGIDLLSFALQRLT